MPTSPPVVVAFGDVQQVVLVNHQSTILSVCLRAGGLISYHRDGDNPEIFTNVPFGGSKDKLAAAVVGDLLHLVWSVGGSVVHARWNLATLAVDKNPAFAFQGTRPSMALGQNEQKLLVHYISPTGDHESRGSTSGGDSWEAAFVVDSPDNDIEDVDVNISQLADTEASWVNTRQAIPSALNLQFYVDANQPGAGNVPTDLGLLGLGDSVIQGTAPTYGAATGPNSQAAWTFIRAQGTYAWNNGAGADIASDQYSWLMIVKPTRVDGQEGRFFDSNGTASLYRGFHDENSVGPGNRGFLTDLNLSSYVGTGAPRNATDWFAIFAIADGTSDQISFRNLTVDPNTTVNGPIGAWDASTTGTEINLGGGFGFATECVIHALLHWDSVVDTETAMAWAKTKAGF